MTFIYRRATSFSEAAAILADPAAQPLGGGTDLPVSIEDGITAPSTLVDLRSIKDADALTWSSDDAVRIGAAVRVHVLSTDAGIRERFPALGQACGVVGSPALRHMGTIGGNVCQRPRCWCLRRGIACLKNGGTACPARDGENQYHAILDAGPCYIVRPSDPAVALTALDARVELTSASDVRVLPLAEFYALPRDRMDQETVLKPGEIVSAILLDGAAARGR